MKVLLHPHALERLSERGAAESEVTAVVESGERFPAKFGRTGFVETLFTAATGGGDSIQRQVEAYAIEEQESWLVITVVVRYF